MVLESRSLKSISLSSSEGVGRVTFPLEPYKRVLAWPFPPSRAALLAFLSSWHLPLASKPAA